MSFRITFKYLAYGAAGYIPIRPGEPVFDPSTRRLGIGVGGSEVIWFPKATPNGNLEFDPGQGLISADNQFELKFTQTGMKWKVSGTEVLSTRGSQGIAVQSAIMMRNEAGADVVLVGYGHYMALLNMLMRLKALLRKFVAGTATSGDVDALLTPLAGVDLKTLNPAFPESSAL